MKSILSILFLILSVNIHAQVEVYFPRYMRAAKSADIKKEIQENDTVKNIRITTKKHVVYNRAGEVTELKDANYLTKSKTVYSYNHRGALSGSKIYSAHTNKLLTVSTINYITFDSIVEVLMTPKLKPLATKIIVKKGNTVTSNFYVNKGEDSIRTKKTYLLDTRGLVVKSTEERFKNGNLNFSLVETTNYTKFDEYNNYIEATGTIDKFNYKLTRNIEYMNEPPPRRNFNKPQKSLKFGIGYNYSFGKPNTGNFHGLDVSLMLENKYRHGNAKFYGIGSEIFLNDGNVILGPKITMQTRVFAFLVGASLVNYTDFKNNSLRLVPELGFGGDEVTFTVKPHIVLNNKNFRPVNNVSVGLTYFFN